MHLLQLTYAVHINRITMFVNLLISKNGAPVLDSKMSRYEKQSSLKKQNIFRFSGHL